jgi:hypothetical protein
MPVLPMRDAGSGWLVALRCGFALAALLLKKMFGWK